MANTWGPSVQLYGANMINPYGGHMVFVHLLHMVPIWVTDPAHSFHKSCPQLRPYGSHTVFVHLLHMGPMWVANIQYGSHVGCQYGSQILPTFAQDLDHISAFKSPVRFLSTCFMRLTRGLLNRIPIPGKMEHCTSSIGSLFLAKWNIARPQ